jgi:hypothetical protein
MHVRTFSEVTVVAGAQNGANLLAELGSGWTIHVLLLFSYIREYQTLGPVLAGQLGHSPDYLPELSEW